MRNLKKFESFKNEESIKDLCSKYEIGNYQIRDDGSIDVEGGVWLQGKISYNRLRRENSGVLGNLKKLPLIFNKVSGGFDCNENKLTTLKGCPKEADRFDCSRNPITSFKHSPEKVKSFSADYTFITSLEGLENIHIDDFLSVNNCYSLYTLKGFPKKVSRFFISGTPINSIYYKFIEDIDNIHNFNSFDVIYMDGGSWYISYDNLNRFLRSVDKEDKIMSDVDFDNFMKTVSIGTYRWDY